MAVAHSYLHMSVGLSTQQEDPERERADQEEGVDRAEARADRRQAPRGLLQGWSNWIIILKLDSFCTVTGKKRQVRSAIPVIAQLIRDLCCSKSAVQQPENLQKYIRFASH